MVRLIVKNKREEKIMKQNSKETFKALWEMRQLTVDECLKKISTDSALKFLVTAAGAWFLFRQLIGMWIGAHLLYFIYRVFHLVLA